LALNENLNESLIGRSEPLKLISIAAYIYLFCLALWAVFHALFGDHWWWLFFINAFSLYLFLPLPGVVAFALLTRRWELGAATSVAVALGVSLYGGLFLSGAQSAHTSGKTLTVMTYNMLGPNRHSEAVVATIRTAAADVVALQELNHAVAATIQTELMDLYPYQVLAPQSGVSGMGVISRYPLQTTGEHWPGGWIGQPQVLRLRYDDQVQVTLVNIHAVSVEFDGWAARQAVEWSVHERQREAQLIADFAAAEASPVIVLGDFNTTDQSVAYGLMTGTLRDGWRDAGWGWGHTFPSAVAEGSAEAILAGLFVPTWLIRIDYIFYSAHWRALTARLAPWDGGSDHRPVVASLVLVE
jgi:vancomycin resistance protein VanJ